MDQHSWGAAEREATVQRCRDAKRLWEELVAAWGSKERREGSRGVRDYHLGGGLGCNTKKPPAGVKVIQ